MESLQRENEGLREELAAAKKYAQECEDEAVELRWQLHKANAELKKQLKA
eukprot:CAMPEP_0173423160 /NCGR_PEP_ID=MMETSP1357-20121228/3579_1 /TAXON_ID=77926 /ORGANISM="Hemiselmis rufescens, Strain PCC563" /LENGTH=49 /DNA_ID= /DNA_START= /DNA_END= /DNA_ORIENTATION=